MKSFILLTAILPLASAFVAQPVKSGLTLSTPSTELNMAWHEYARADPYTRNRNGDVSVLRNEYYQQRGDRLGNVQQPQGYYNNYNNNNYQLSGSNTYRNSYNGPYANSDSARRYSGYGNSGYGYNNMRDGYSSRINNGRFPPEDGSRRSSSLSYNNYNNDQYSTSRYGYNSGNGYSNNNMYSSQSRYGYNNNYNDYSRNGRGGSMMYSGNNYQNYDNYRQGPWLNSGRFPDENGSLRYEGSIHYDYQQRGGRQSYGPYSNNGYGGNSGYGNSRYGYDSYGSNGRSGYGRSW
ncbi:hypothetical protein MPSEU_000358200 [Mayamaea pseudoterrestris]|nr:hypothetical protein MPSEU_000358200 [Mayamaea pseudoterrestris]